MHRFTGTIKRQECRTIQWDYRCFRRSNSWWNSKRVATWLSHNNPYLRPFVHVLSSSEYPNRNEPFSIWYSGTYRQCSCPNYGIPDKVHNEYFHYARFNGGFCPREWKSTDTNPNSLSSSKSKIMRHVMKHISLTCFCNTFFINKNFQFYSLIKLQIKIDQHVKELTLRRVKFLSKFLFFSWVLSLNNFSFMAILLDHRILEARKAIWPRFSEYTRLFNDGWFSCKYWNKMNNLLWFD